MQMLKAKLILEEMPRHCEDCPLHDISSMRGDWICLPANKWIDTFRDEPRHKPEWCPLIPVEAEEKKEKNPFVDFNPFAKEVYDR